MKVWNFSVLVFSLLPLGMSRSADTCIEIPADPESRPPDCDDVNHPFYDPLWCTCLVTTLTNNRANQPALIQQSIVYVTDQPTPGKYVISVQDGYLDLGAVAVDDYIGEMLINVPVPGAPQNFYVLLGMIVTGVTDSSIDFDIVVVDTNETSKEIFVYDPMDEEHAFGLIYRGTVVPLGEAGFELTFEYIMDITSIYPNALNTGIEAGDLQAPNFSVPLVLTFPLPEKQIYYLPPDDFLEIITTVDQMFTSPPIQREFIEDFDLNISEDDDFRRGDTDGSGQVNLADAVLTLFSLFGGGSNPGCLDAADSDDDGSVEINDVIALLTYLFRGGPPPADPGPNQCGPDPNADSLLPCSYKDC